MLLGFLDLRFLGDVNPYRLKHHIEVERVSEDGQKSGGIELVRTEIVEHRALVVEKGFDIDQLDRPRSLLEES